MKGYEQITQSCLPDVKFQYTEKLDKKSLTVTSTTHNQVVTPHLIWVPVPQEELKTSHLKS